MINNGLYDRYAIDKLTIGEVYALLTDSRYSMFFVVYVDEGYRRYRLPSFKDFQHFTNYMHASRFRVVDGGIDSSSFVVEDGDYIDCYKKKPY